MHSCVGGRKGSSDSLRSVLPLSQRGADGPPSLEADFPGKARWRVGAIRWIGDPVAPLFDTPESARRENMEVMARLTDEEGDPFAHMARSRVNPLEVRQIITEPDRDRRLRVADGQRRSYHSHLPHPETTRNMRNNPLPILSIPKSNSRGIHIRMPVRSATEGKGPPRLGLRERRPLKSNPPNPFGHLYCVLRGARCRRGSLFLFRQSSLDVLPLRSAFLALHKIGFSPLDILRV